MDPIEKLKSEIAAILKEQTAILDEADAKTNGVLSKEQREKFDALEKSKAEKESALKEAEDDKRRREQLTASNGRHGQPQRRVADSSTEIRPLSSEIDRDPSRGFRTPREFMLGVIEATRDGRIEDRRLMPLARLAVGSDEHGEYSDPYGGFVVPEAFSPNLMTTMADADPIGSRVTQIPMTAPTVSMMARVDKNHSSSVSGGLTVTRREETGTVSAARFSMERIKLETNSIFGLAYATEELLSDSPISFAALIEAGFREEFGAKLIDERINGTGVGEFMGILASPCLVSVAKEGGQVADSIVGQNLVKMRSRCWRYSNAVWLYNHDCLPQLTAAHITGTNGDVAVWHSSLREGEPDMLLGRPAIATEWCKTIGDQGDIILADWSQYLEGTYQPLQSAESIHVRFLEHERTFKFWLRNAGAPWWRSSLTPKNSASTLSPFVVLDARA